jgi:hypothetical protein
LSASGYFPSLRPLEQFTAMHNSIAASHHSGHSGFQAHRQRIKMSSKNNDVTWKTRYGPRRVRQEDPTLEEAILAAQGLSDDLDEQAKIAASLMGLPTEQVREQLLKMPATRKDVVRSVAFAGPASAPRVVVVERKPTRRGIAGVERGERLISRR